MTTDRSTRTPDRRLGRSGIEVSPMGLGCWTIGGPFWRDGTGLGWGDVDDDESKRAIRAGLDHGVTFFDTSDVYGCGHSESVLGEAIEGGRDGVVLATKFGNVFDEETRQITGTDVTDAGIRRSCRASLRRLRTDWIDLYQIHLAAMPLEQADDVAATLEALVAEGTIRGYGWSTDDIAKAEAIAAHRACTAIQHPLSLVNDRRDLVRLCERQNLASVVRSPLAMGVLSGKYRSALPVFDDDDIRRDWQRDDGPRHADHVGAAEELRSIVAADGRTPAQAAIAWVWSTSEVTIPIPGFRTAEQVLENVAAMTQPPLGSDIVKALDDVAARPPQQTPP